MNEIIINGRYLIQPLTGVQRYAHEVVKAFDDLLKQNEIDRDRYKFILAVPPDLQRFPDYEFIQISRVGKFKNNLWEQISLPFFSRGKILFNPCNSGPVLGGKQQIITIHDASVFAIPEAYKPLFRFKHKIITFFMGKKAAKIITDSEFSKSELVKYGKIGESRIQVIPLGSEHISSLDLDKNLQSIIDIDAPYILFVGSQAKHKNEIALIQAMEILNQNKIKLVIAGGAYSKVFSGGQNGTKPWLIRLGYVSDGDLKVLYENALCFVYASFYEGFGLPPLEAMSCGCPVLASRAASLPEVCGEAALYFDPMNPEELAEKIRCLIDNPVERNKMIHKGYEQAKNFAWAKTAKMLWKEMVEILD